MPEDRSIDILDYLIIILKSKKFLIGLFILTILISYGIIYYFVDKEYDSSALILPLDDTSVGSISGIMKNLKDLPFGLGGSSKTASTDLYITLIHSRFNLENMIKKFDLLKDYHTDSIEEALKVLSKKIDSKETKENAFLIKVRANSADKSVEMVNYIVNFLNSKIIELNISKSRNNRIFLEDRYNELKKNLKNSEDSLQMYQQKSGLFEAKEQIKIIASAFSDLEVRVISKESEMQIVKNFYNINSPQYKAIESEYLVLKDQLSSLKNNTRNESLLISLKSLPEKAKLYLRYYRDVEIYNKILEFIVPLYEQAKIEEQKSIPVLQVVDYGIRPEKKSYPPRLLLSFLIAFIVLIFAIFSLLVRELWQSSDNPKLAVVKNLLGFKNKTSK
jgi:capsule polysaccharide export protein KpsE/RkpR